MPIGTETLQQLTLLRRLEQRTQAVGVKVPAGLSISAALRNGGVAATPAYREMCRRIRLTHPRAIATSDLKPASARCATESMRDVRTAHFSYHANFGRAPKLHGHTGTMEVPTSVVQPPRLAFVAHHVQCLPTMTGCVATG